jgi:hypothetical protein
LNCTSFLVPADAYPALVHGDKWISTSLTVRAKGILGIKPSITVEHGTSTMDGGSLVVEAVDILRMRFPM